VALCDNIESTGLSLMEGTARFASAICGLYRQVVLTFTVRMDACLHACNLLTSRLQHSATPTPTPRWQSSTHTSPPSRHHGSLCVRFWLHPAHIVNAHVGSDRCQRHSDRGESRVRRYRCVSALPLPSVGLLVLICGVFAKPKPPCWGSNVVVANRVALCCALRRYRASWHSRRQSPRCHHAPGGGNSRPSRPGLPHVRTTASWLRPPPLPHTSPQTNTHIPV